MLQIQYQLSIKVGYKEKSETLLLVEFLRADIKNITSLLNQYFIL